MGVGIYRVVGCVIIHNIDHNFQTQIVSFLNEPLEVIFGPVLWIDVSVILYRVRTSKVSFLVQFTLKIVRRRRHNTIAFIFKILLEIQANSVAADLRDRLLQS